VKKLLLFALFIGFVTGCANQPNRPNPPKPPPGPIVNPIPPTPTPPPVVEQRGAVFVPPFGTDSLSIPASALTVYKPLTDKFLKVYGDLKKPLFARGQADGGVSLVYNIAGSKQRAYFIFRGGDGLLIRVAQN
jgi:hypothetical protein